MKAYQPKTDHLHSLLKGVCVLWILHTASHTTEKEDVVIKVSLGKTGTETSPLQHENLVSISLEVVSHNTCSEVYILRYSIRSQRSSKTPVAYLTWYPLLPLVPSLEGRKKEIRDWKITTVARDNKTLTSNPAADANSFANQFGVLPEMTA